MAALYKTVSIEIADYKAAIERWTTILESTHSWGTPQRVRIGASAAFSTEIEHDMIKMGDSRLLASLGNWGAQQPPNPNFEAQVLIDFLRKLPSLSDLEWQTSTPLAPPLLQFLRHQLPSCNLHLKPLHIPFGADPYSIWSVLCLPSLQTIWLERKEPCNIQDLVQHILRSPGGNLRELRISWPSTGGASPFGEPSPIPWDLGLEPHDGERLGQLQYLQLAGNEGAEATSLQTWARHTDFGQLRALSLEIFVDREALETLINLPLQSLHSLGLVVLDMSDDYSAALQTFIGNLPSLSHLRLTGTLPPSALKAILDHLDSTLHTLYLIPESLNPCRFVFDSSTIALVTDRCKHVRELGTSIRRAWNKPGEDIAVLKAIGRMPHLSSLSLTFDVSDYTLLVRSNDDNSEPRDLAPSDPSFSAFDTEPFQFGSDTDKQPRNGHIRDALINSAVDAELAKAVFNTVLSATPEGETPSLQRLSLKATRGGHFGTSALNGGISWIAREVGKEWIVERSGHDDVLEVRRAEVDDEEEVVELSESESESASLTWELPWDIKPIFRRIWPGDGDWINEWHAFPLV
ncbi:uncharacterized protein F4812DRAFT_67326 [Daldinia caldariorum]|uniref:uncharacterized protein n=1 Tax=Daldinia caldariorum TaxID=326644 RepID=UPI00200849D2|nr:uncharacterized protein F4812DRAFT_67326 [Daldinia caldariorum]KAI1466804.1 hypothetical protein F4812DRAFT_67326 [Daldinia caldariorum]